MNLDSVLSEIPMSTQATLDQPLLFNQAMSFHQKGMLTQAGQIYLRLIAAQPLSAGRATCWGRCACNTDAMKKPWRVLGVEPWRIAQNFGIQTEPARRHLGHWNISD